MMSMSQFTAQRRTTPFRHQTAPFTQVTNQATAPNNPPLNRRNNTLSQKQVLERVPEEDTQSMKQTQTHKEDDNMSRATSKRVLESTSGLRQQEAIVENEEEEIHTSAMNSSQRRGREQDEPVVQLKEQKVKKSYLDFTHKKDFQLLQDPQFFKCQRSIGKFILSRSILKLNITLTGLYLIFKACLLLAAVPLVAKGQDYEFSTMIRFLRADFIFLLVFIVFDMFPHIFTFRKFYHQRAPLIRFNLFFLICSFILVIMNFIELYKHHSSISSKTDQTQTFFSNLSSLDAFIPYFNSNVDKIDYRSMIFGLYIIFSSIWQVIKSLEVRDRYRRLMGYYNSPQERTEKHHNEEQLQLMEQSSSLIDRSNSSFPYHLHQLLQMDPNQLLIYIESMRRSLQKTSRIVQNTFPEAIREVEACLMIIDKLSRPLNQQQMNNSSSFLSEDYFGDGTYSQRGGGFYPGANQGNNNRESSSFSKGHQIKSRSSSNQPYQEGSEYSPSPPKIRKNSQITGAMGSSVANFPNTNNNLQFEITLNPGKHASYLTSYNQAIKNCLANLDNINFNIFDLQRVSSGREFMIIGFEIAQRNYLLDKCQVHKYTYINFLDGLARSYNEQTIAPYHSRTHAADVMQALHVFMNEGGLQQLLQLKPLEHFGAIVAAMSHDVDHPGLSNGFLVNSKDEMALLYNDQSVLENHHVAQTFMLLKEEELDILSHLSQEDYRKVREIIIKMVLATDMTVHAASMKELKSITEKVTNNQNSNNSGTDTSNIPSGQFSNNQFIHIEEELRSTHKVFLLSQALHFADITNPCREWVVCQRWTDLVFREFFAQGDLERSMKLPISFLMDKRITNIAESQVNFINFIVEPALKEFGKLCRGVVSGAPGQYLFHNMNRNRQSWADLKPVFEQYREQSTVLDPELHLDSTLDIGSMHLSLDDDFFKPEKYAERKRKRLQLIANQLTNNNQTSSSATQHHPSPSHNVSQRSNQNDPHNSSPQKHVDSHDNTSRQFDATIVIDAPKTPPAKNPEQLVQRKKSQFHMQGKSSQSIPSQNLLNVNHQHGSSARMTIEGVGKRATKEINDSSFRTEFEGSISSGLILKEQ